MSARKILSITIAVHVNRLVLRSLAAIHASQLVAIVLLDSFLIHFQIRNVFKIQFGLN